MSNPWEVYRNALPVLAEGSIQSIVVTCAPGYGVCTAAYDLFEEIGQKYVDYRVDGFHEWQALFDAARQCKEDGSVLILSDYGRRFWEQPTNNDEMLKLLNIGAKMLVVTNEGPHSMIRDHGLYIYLSAPDFVWGPAGHGTTRSA